VTKFVKIIQETFVCPRVAPGFAVTSFIVPVPAPKCLGLRPSDTDGCLLSDCTLTMTSQMTTATSNVTTTSSSTTHVTGHVMLSAAGMAAALLLTFIY